MIEIIRQLPAFAFVGDFLHMFTDDRDVNGPVIKTHIYLLFGCGFPMWFNGASYVPFITRFIGVASVAVGDSFAAAVGTSIGKHPIFGTHKTYEGFFAFIFSTLVALRDDSFET